MKPLARLLPILVVVAATLPTPSGACVIALGTRGAFAEVESSGARCLTFVDAMGNTYEILSPSPVWKPGMKGLIFAEHAGSGRCTSYPALRICSFQGEAVRTVAGTLAWRDSGDCSGFVIASAEGDIELVNCADFGAALCDERRLGRPVRADVYVQGPADACPERRRATVLAYEFPD